MIFARRLIHVMAWAGTLAVALIALALIVSQTPWFRDWIRVAIIREAREYLNGELTIGRIDGNLFFGIRLSDVAVNVSDDRAIAVKTLAVEYSIARLLSRGTVIDSITMTSPAIRASRDAEGWNIGDLIKPRREPARDEPRRPLSLSSIVITDGTVLIEDAVGSTRYTLPRRIEHLNLKAALAYAPGLFSVTLNQLTLRAASPDLALHEMTGTIVRREDNLHLDRLAIKTGESALTIAGVVEQYSRTPVITLAVDGTASLPEIGRVLPSVSGFELHPRLNVKTDGTADRLSMALDTRSEAGLIRGQLTADLSAPDFRFVGPLHVERLNLAPILKNPGQRSDITGDLRVDVSLPSQPDATPPLDRLGGTFSFSGPHVLALGYEARQVQAHGSFKGPRVTLASSRVDAYGGSATASGVIVLPHERRPVSYDLRGSTENVDLRRLPTSLRVPPLESNLALAEYTVQGSGGTASGSATLNQSEVEGARIEAGTHVQFEVGKGPFRYAATATVRGLNVQRLGRALQIRALDDPRYDGQVNGAFDVAAAGTSLAELTLTASGTLTDSSIVGVHTPQLAFKASIDDGALTVQANGPFDHLNPAAFSGRRAVDGNVNGRVDGTFRIPDLSAPVTPASIAANGRVTFGPSLIGSVQVAAADVEGRYEREIADITRLQVKGPDVTLDASGRLALDRSSASNLKYHVDAPDISEVGDIAGVKDLEGSLVLDGILTGNAGVLETNGTLKGTGIAWDKYTAETLTSKYSATVADFDFAAVRVEATTDAATLVVAGVPLERVTASTTYANKELGFSTTIRERAQAQPGDTRAREIEAGGRIVFHLDHQEIHLPSLVLRTDGIEWRNAPDAVAAVQVRDGQLLLDNVRLISGDQGLDVKGSIALAGKQAQGSLAVNARDVDISQLERLLLQNRGFSGRLTADATITGTLDQPSVDGRVEIRDGGFREYRYQSLVADVDYIGKRIALDATLQQTPEASITAKGTLPVSLFSEAATGHVAPTGEDAIDLRFHTSSVSLGIFQGLTTAITNIGGTVQADVRVTGSGSDPHFEGFVELRDAAFAVPRFGTSYSGLDTRIDLESDLVRIRRFEILDENGEQLAIAGQIGVHERQVGAVDITLESENFEIIDNELGDLGVGTRLKITGELLRPKVEGDVRVVAGRLEVDRILQLLWDPYRVEELPDVVSAERTAEAAGSAQEATRIALARAGQTGREPAAEVPGDKAAAPEVGGFDRLALDIRVRVPDNLVLRGRRLKPGGPTRAAIGDINITVGGDLNVRKDPETPITLAGTINPVRGTYQFQSRQFELERDGTIRFTGDSELDAVLDVSAVRQIPDTGVEARVRVTGTIKNPELHLSSTPPLDESDVLALIIFNRPITDLGTSERASLAGIAGGIATGFLATPLSQSIGRALDLDLFEITATTEGDAFGAGITIGDQIGSRTFLKLRQTFGERVYSEFLLEYRLADYLRLVASAAPETSGAANRIGQRRIERAGLDLIFFFSY